MILRGVDLIVVSTSNDGMMSNLCIYSYIVDDMLITAKSKEEIRIVKTQFNNEFEMEDLAVTKKILGMEIMRDRVAGRLSLSKKGYIEKVVLKFNM